MKKAEKKYYTRGNLKSAGGWTDKLIDELLGEPDYIKDNFHQPGRVLHRRVNSYLVSRVEAAEKTKAFKDGWREVTGATRRMPHVGDEPYESTFTAVYHKESK